MRILAEGEISVDLPHYAMRGRCRQCWAESEVIHQCEYVIQAIHTKDELFESFQIEEEKTGFAAVEGNVNSPIWSTV